MHQIKCHLLFKSVQGVVYCGRLTADHDCQVNANHKVQSSNHKAVNNPLIVRKLAKSIHQKIIQKSKQIDQFDDQI